METNGFFQFEIIIECPFRGGTLYLKKKGAQRARGLAPKIFLAYLRQFRGLFKVFGRKRGGRALSPLDSRLQLALSAFE